MLVGVVVVLALLITPQLRDWWVQQRQLHEQRSQIAASQREVDALRAERARWEDPAYVKAQARERLHFVMPGEKGFAVAGGSTVGVGGSSAVARREQPQDRPWFTDLWTSTRVAADPGLQRKEQPLSDRELIRKRAPGAPDPDQVLVDQGAP